MATRFPRRQDLAFVRLVEAVENAHERALAGAVLAEERVHLAGPHIEVDVVVGDHPGEPLRDAAHFQQRHRVARRTGRVLRGGRLDRHTPLGTTILPLTIPSTTFCAFNWIAFGVFAALLNWIFSPPFFSEIRYETPPSFPFWTRVDDLVEERHPVVHLGRNDVLGGE